MIPTYKDIVRKTNDRVMPPTFAKGMISNVYWSIGTADVVVVGNNQTTLHNVRLSSAVPSTVKTGDLCRIDFFDPSNPKDMVVAYIY